MYVHRSYKVTGAVICKTRLKGGGGFDGGSPSERIPNPSTRGIRFHSHAFGEKKGRPNCRRLLDGIHFRVRGRLV